MPDFSCPLEDGSQQHAPLTPVENHLAALWSEILGVPEIGSTDNFFECGGDSLLGLRMANRLRKTLGENVSLVAVFEAPTIGALARYLESHHAAGLARLTGPDLVAMNKSTSSPDPAVGSLPGITAVPREGRRVLRSSLVAD